MNINPVISYGSLISAEAYFKQGYEFDEAEGIRRSKAGLVARQAIDPNALEKGLSGEIQKLVKNIIYKR